MTDFAQIAKLAATRLPVEAHMTALRLAQAHNHMWATEEAQRLLADASNTAALEAALVTIQNESARLNGPDGGSGPLGLELRNTLKPFQAGGEVAPCYTHSTASGRLSWNIVPAEGGEWFMTLSVCRPAVSVAGRAYPEGVCLEARFSSLEGWDVRWGMGAPFYQRHLETLQQAILATGLVDGPLDDLPLIANSIHANPQPEWRDGRQWHDVVLAAGENLDRIGAALIADLKTRYGTEVLAAVLTVASELDSHGDLTRALRRAM